MVNAKKPLDKLNVFELLDLERKIARKLKKPDSHENQNLWTQHRQIIRKLTNFAVKDPLTHLLNRNGYQALLEGLVQKSVRQQRNFSHLLFDIDDFRQVNTNYGHKIGDKILQSAAGVILNQLGTPGYSQSYAALLRAEHPVRMGGEEIAVLLPEKTTKDGMKIAERIRRGIEKFREEKLPPITISGGVISFDTMIKAYNALNYQPEDYDIEEALYVFCDYALYHSKNTGKNKVTTFEEAIVEPITAEREKKLGRLVDLATSYRKSQGVE